MSEKLTPGQEIYDTIKTGYVSNNIMVFSTNGETNKNASIFSFEYLNPDNSCDIDRLKQKCNDTDCIGFVHAPSNNTYQMITSKSTSGNYKITSSMQDFYLKDVSVNLKDNSCEPGPVSYMSGSLLSNYPQGKPFVSGGKNQCKVVKAPKKIENFTTQDAQYLVDTFQNVQFDKDTTHVIKQKTQEYVKVIDSIKSLKPSVTLEQQFTDMKVFDEQNKTALILWSVLTVAILGVVFFRMK